MKRIGNLFDQVVSEQALYTGYLAARRAKRKTQACLRFSSRLGAEIGAGWDRTGPRGLYIALQIDDPSLAAPLRANLVRLGPDDGDLSILCSRPEPQAGN